MPGSVDLLNSARADQLHHLGIVALNHIVRRRRARLSLGNSDGKGAPTLHVCDSLFFDIQSEPLIEGLAERLRRALFQLDCTGSDKLALLPGFLNPTRSSRQAFPLPWSSGGHAAIAAEETVNGRVAELRRPKPNG